MMRCSLVILSLVAFLSLPLCADTAAKSSIRLSQVAFSPNGDGLVDSTVITGNAPGSASVKVSIVGSKGRKVIELNPTLSDGKFSVTWDGLSDGKAIPNGSYKVVAAFDGAQKTEATADVKICNIRKWPEVKYQTKPFFPIGVWFEGAPWAAGYPGDPVGAKKYYDRCFKDLSDHGFNAVAVPNCPQGLWETLLQSAEEHNIKVVLEISPLSVFVHGGATDEPGIYEAAKRVYAKIGKYDSLLRYQIRDEPSPDMRANWMAVQRIMAAVDPKRPVFSCFCAGETLAAFTERTPFSEAVWDCYPHLESMPEQQMGYFIPALKYAWVPSSRNYPMWAVLQTFKAPGVWRYPTREEVRADTYLSLAAGAKGVFYFIYQSMPNHGERLGGLVDPQGKPLPIYTPVKAIVRELGALSPYIFSLKPADFKAKAQDGVMVGSFVDSEGRSVIIVANEKPEMPQDAAVESVPDGVWKDYLSGETFKAQDGQLSVPLRPGAGEVLVKI